jgi:2-oxoglutarate dehydrogenase E2 component (dihydrolipoamide succinyltransferase)
MTIELKIPAVGESIQEVQIGQWLKREGDRVRQDEAVVELETDKASMELSAPINGVVAKILKRDGESVAVGDVIGYFESDGGSGGAGSVAEKSRESTAASKPAEHPTTVERKTSPPPRPPVAPVAPARASAAPRESVEIRSEDRGQASVEREPAAPPSVRRLLREHNLRAQDVKPSGEGNRLLRTDVVQYLEEHANEPTAPEVLPPPTPDESAAAPRSSLVREPSVTPGGDDAERVVPMTLIRRRIAERLVEARQQMAILTTFNEVDMSAIIELRSTHRERFQQTYGVKLGFMSFFVKATVDALRQIPAVNAEIRGTDIVYRDHYHIGVAIGASRGLVVPVLRYAERLTFAGIEQAIADFAQRAEANKLEPNDLVGGTFTITNGGTYGSLLSTPIVNPPQSGVLGMHTIQERPVARDGQVVIRPMMYVALSYDHRLIDGREAVTFLKRVKEAIEDPARLLIGV